MSTAQKKTDMLGFGFWAGFFSIFSFFGPQHTPPPPVPLKLGFEHDVQALRGDWDAAVARSLNKK